MLYSLRSSWNKSRFDWLTRGILHSPPVELVDADWSFVSMVGITDVQMYLLSMKSIYTRIKRGKIIAIIARDMPQWHRDLLERHFIGIQIQILDDIDVGACQRGGTWERLVFLLRHARQEYAIQVDCDTLAFGANLDEVTRCIEGNQAFTLSAGGEPVRTMREYAENAHNIDDAYIGIVAERLFEQYPRCDELKYVRASSAFAGFPVGGLDLSFLEEFHENMQRLLGKRWQKWGTEQCGSNFAMANSPSPCILPYPKYANYSPNLGAGQNAFLHFFGTHRYDGDYFVTKGRQVIDQLRLGLV